MNKLENIKDLFQKVKEVIDQSRKHIVTTVNSTMVCTYFAIGYFIVENEQKGKSRAKYGKSQLIELSKRLTETYGKGWSVENLTLFRKFYLIYSTDWLNQSTETSSLQTTNFVNTVYDFQNKITLTWSHYLVLIRIENPDERHFYEIEAKNQCWSVRQLSRQYNSSLYERLALSRDKQEVMKLSQKGQTVEKSNDIMKNPLTLEFLGLKVESSYSETKLEQGIISKMQDFLLELGKGFLFEARQKRFIFNEDCFFVDLVFYNRLLQCYVLIDLKIDKLTHQDLGQMQMYVNYFDRYIKQNFEKPTIGILLCKEKNDALVQLTLPKNSNIYAQEYSLYLPDKKLLQQKMQQWINELNENGQFDSDGAQ